VAGFDFARCVASGQSLEKAETAPKSNRLSADISDSRAELSVVPVVQRNQIPN
jgi:hypothetical protein